MAETYSEIVTAVLGKLLRDHPSVPYPTVEGVVLDAAGELAGGVDFRRRLLSRSAARLSAMTGVPIVITRVGAMRLGEFA